MVRKGIFYTKSHEWVRFEGEEAYIGISAYAAQEMGDIVYVELPEEGEAVTAGEPFGSIEAVKAVEDVNSPMSGIILEINEDLEDTPELVGKDAYGDGWLIHIKLTELSEKEHLLDAAAYTKLIEES